MLIAGVFSLVVIENHDDGDDKPERKRQRVEINCQDSSLKVHNCIMGML